MAKEGKAVSLTALYSELNQQEKNSEFDRALKTANKILQIAHEDSTAFHCKIVCLIQLGKHLEVLKHISISPDLSKGLLFEKAYSEYRLNRTNDALATLRSDPNPDHRVQELLAQVLYRKEEYEEAFSIYKGLIKNTQDDFEEERNTNLSAVMAALQMWDGQDVGEVGLEEDTYEICYNAACGLIGLGQYEAALEKLKSAEALCRQTYEDDADITPEEVDTELGDIRVQMGYALQQLGKNEEALKYYNMVIKSRPTDIGLIAVASNNIITLNKDQNVFDSQKRIKALQTDGLQQKLTRLQKQALTLNQSLFYLLQNKNDLCRKSLQTLKKEEVDSDISAMLEAALCSKEKNPKKAVQVLETECEKSESLQLRLALVQLLLSQGHVYQACDALKNLGDDTYRLGVVSTLVMLYLSQEDHDSASEVLLNTINWYKKNKPSSPDLALLMRTNAKFQMKRDNAKGATDMLEELRKRNPGDMKTLAQLIAAYSKFDPKKAQLVSRELPLPSDLSKVMDVDSLEMSANLGPRYIKKTLKVEQSPMAHSPKSGDGALIQKKKKKKKKVKLPKNYDPSGTTDAERWLPLRERTYYRGKRKKKQGVGKGTQGAVSGASVSELDKSQQAPSTTQSAPGEKQEAAAGTASPKPGGATGAPGSTTPAAGPRTQKPAGKQQKKKKKGSKW